jgi:hypothetical protein
MAVLEDLAKALATGTPGQAIGISPERTAVPITAGGASPSPSSATPQPIGTATAGTSADYARGDHVHAAALADLSDVAATAPTSGQVLAWGGSEWAPATPASAPSPSSSTPQAIGTATAGTSTDYSRGDHVHAAQVVALGDRFERLPLQASSEFAAPTVRDVQTAIDAHTSGAAAVVVLAPGSYPGATVTITGTRANFAVCGPVGQPYGGTIATLSSGRGLSVGGTCQRIRVQNLQIEGLTTWNPSGAGVHRVDRCQMLGGLTLGTSWPVGTYLVITDCSIAGTITIPAGFPGVVLFDRVDFTGATFAIGAGVSALQVSISSCTGLATVPSPATINAFNAIGASVQAFFNGSQGSAGQVLTSAGAGAAPTWQTPSGSTGGTLGPFTATPGAPYSYTPTGAEKAYIVELKGGGAGAGSGPWAASGNRYGGGGGGGGGYTCATIPASLITGPVTLTAGAAGTGGAAPAALGDPGVSGTDGGDSTFGTVLRAGGGKAGTGTASGVASAGGAGGTGMYPGAAGGDGSTGGTAGLPGAQSGFGAGAGGGGGAGISAAGTASAVGGDGGDGAAANGAYSAVPVLGGPGGTNVTDRSGGDGDSPPAGSPYSGGGGGGGGARGNVGGDNFSGGGGDGKAGSGGGGAGVAGILGVTPRPGGDGSAGLARMWVLT